MKMCCSDSKDVLLVDGVGLQMDVVVIFILFLLLLLLLEVSKTWAFVPQMF